MGERTVGYLRIYDLVKRDDFKGLRALCRSGWDVNQRERWNGGTALLLACELCRPKLVRLLLHHGADPNVVDNDGHNCYDAARSWPIRRMLVAAGFSWQPHWTKQGDWLGEMRHLTAAERVDRTVTSDVTGTDLRLEYQIQPFPPMVGSVGLTVRGDGADRPGHEVELTAPGHGDAVIWRAQRPATVTFAVTLRGFRGDVRARVFCADTYNPAMHVMFWGPPWPRGFDRARGSLTRMPS